MTEIIDIRPANVDDRSKLEYFLTYEFFVHQHLDWQPSLDWLGTQPFYLALKNNEIIACIAAPSEVNNIAWIRLFACSALYSRDQIWKLLFPHLVSYLKGNINLLAALGIHQWFSNLLLNNSFNVHQNIIVFEWKDNPPAFYNPRIELEIKPLQHYHIHETALLDRRCFDPLWQLPENSMKKAFNQAGYSTVTIHQNQIVGYQITTETYHAAHLARLAVDPAFQGLGIGKAILYDLFEYCHQVGKTDISVNTQDDNSHSRSLYEGMGFIQNEEKYPVFVYKL